MTDRTNQTITLKNGRTLGYAEYGDPEGKPVFYFHGFPTSRLDWPLCDHEGITSELGIRIIAIDRPGTGLSAFKRHREILDWPDDVVELADALGIERFGVLGISGGGPMQPHAPTSSPSASPQPQSSPACAPRMPLESRMDTACAWPARARS